MNFITARSPVFLMIGDHMQHTLNDIVKISGIGLHSGKAANLVVQPAGVDFGIVFKRIDVSDKDNVVKALWSNVVDTRLCTLIGNKSGVTIGTIEHLMAALRAFGIDNALIQIDGPEVPILDGSSKEFIQAFDKVGSFEQVSPRRAIRVLKTITYKDADKTVSLSPSITPTYAGQIEYNHPSIGTQRFEMKLVNGNFKHDVADCRTFCLLSDVELMQQNGLALGGSLDNAIVVDDAGIMNEDGLRCADEFIRHKILDAVGDIALAGGLVLGHYEGNKIGHDMNNKLLHALFADDTAWEYVDLLVNPESSDEALYETAAPAVAHAH